jgi:hypothetical protein
MKRITPLFVGLVLLLGAPAVASAASSSCAAYSSQTCTNINTVQTRTFTQSASLPFTGLDVALLLAGAGILIGTGLVVRMISRHES